MLSSEPENTFVVTFDYRLPHELTKVNYFPKNLVTAGSFKDLEN